MRGAEHMYVFLREQVFDEGGLGQVQALRAPEGDSSGEETTRAMIFARMHLSSMHAAPKEDG